MLPESIENCRNLTHLMLGGNEIDEISSDLFHSLENLKTFDLSYNDLMAVPTDLGTKNENITRIFLNDNKIKKGRHFTIEDFTCIFVHFSNFFFSTEITLSNQMLL